MGDRLVDTSQMQGPVASLPTPPETESLIARLGRLAGRLTHTHLTLALAVATAGLLAIVIRGGEEGELVVSDNAPAFWSNIDPARVEKTAVE